MKTDYELLCNQIDALTKDTPYAISNMANASALLWEDMEDINWAGFYTVNEGSLILGPFQGKPACIIIPWGKGVCGTAAASGKTKVVPDVHLFPGHIACDSASASEIVIPLYKNDQVIAVLDIDSPLKARFTEDDRTGLERFAAILQQRI